MISDEVKEKIEYSADLERMRAKLRKEILLLGYTEKTAERILKYADKASEQTTLPLSEILQNISYLMWNRQLPACAARAYLNRIITEGKEDES